jgi:hypothetical protein
MTDAVGIQWNVMLFCISRRFVWRIDLTTLARRDGVRLHPQFYFSICSSIYNMRMETSSIPDMDGPVNLLNYFHCRFSFVHLS